MIDNVTHDAMKRMVKKVEKLCVLVWVIEGAVTTMQAMVDKWKGKAPMNLRLNLLFEAGGMHKE